MIDPVELLRELVSISSVSRQSNRGVISFAQSVLARAGWSFEEYPYVDAWGVEKVNLVAWPDAVGARQNAFHLALVCHTDTVPYAPEWTQATTLLEERSNLHGCGACDVKGFLACMLAVASQLETMRLKKPHGIILTADEEIGCVGARHLAGLNVVTANYAIVGEPTSLKPMAAGKGYCLAEITVYGREAHSAYPDRGASAIYRAAKLIVEIERIANRLKEFRSDAFSPPWTTVNIGEIQGGLAKNIVAPSCRFLLEWRPVASQDPELVADLVRAAIADMAGVDSDLHCEIKILRMQQGFQTDPGCELLRSIAQVSGNEAGAVPFGTEAPWLRKMGAEAVVFGPGSMESAHSPREFVPKEELYRCVEILKMVIQELCG
jgi:acetylornithine deacetylase